MDLETKITDDEVDQELSTTKHRNTLTNGDLYKTCNYKLFETLLLNFGHY